MFYAYSLHDPLNNNQIFYVGKGQDGRAYRHFKALHWKESDHNPHKTRTLQKIKDAGLEPTITIFPCTSEQDAFDMERSMIAHYGRSIDGGVLTNICLGGEGRTHGHIKVHQYTVFRELIAEFFSIKDAATAVGANSSSSIVAACKRQGSSRCPHGYVWCYASETPDWNWVFQKIAPVYQWTNDGILVGRYKSLSEMHVRTKIDVGSVKRFISSSTPKSYPSGYQFSHTPTFPNKMLRPTQRQRPVICVETSAVFESCAAAERYMNGKPSSKNISAACSGAVKTAYGFRWMYHTV